MLKKLKNLSTFGDEKINKFKSLKLNVLYFLNYQYFGLTNIVEENSLAKFCNFFVFKLEEKIIKNKHTCIASGNTHETAWHYLSRLSGNI